MTTTANVPQINKENSIAIFVNTIKAGQAKGAFLIQEANILKKAIDYFNKDVKVKPEFGNNQDPEIVAVNLLIQGCQKVQNSVNNPLSLEDAATIFECFEYWVKLSNGEVKAAEPEPAPKKSAKAVAQSLKTVVEEDDDDNDEEPVERLITVKGKGRA